ncbi:MAG: hypothetical protein KDE66_10695 [Nitrosomonas sp.]|nr:hypothetical protein [Nitrosomonas sp.]
MINPIVTPGNRKFPGVTIGFSGFVCQIFISCIFELIQSVALIFRGAAWQNVKKLSVLCLRSLFLPGNPLPRSHFSTTC